MKAKDMCFIEGSGCYKCQTRFEPDDEICFVSNFMDYVRVYHLTCAPMNGRPLGTREAVIDKEGMVKEKCIVCKGTNVHNLQGCLDCKKRIAKMNLPPAKEEGPKEEKKLPPAKEEKKDGKTN